MLLCVRPSYFRYCVCHAIVLYFPFVLLASVIATSLTQLPPTYWYTFPSSGKETIRVMGDEKDIARKIISNALEISQSELLMMETRHSVVMRKAYSEINSSNPEDPKNNQIMIKMRETYDKFKRNEERETKRVEESTKEMDRERRGILNKVLNQTSGRVNKKNDLQMTIRKYKENEKGQILDVITISSDDDQSSNSMSSSSKSKLSVRRSTLNGKPKRKRRKVERENNRTGKDSSNGKIAESDKSKQPVPREFIDWLEGIPDLPPDTVKTILDPLLSLEVSSQNGSTITQQRVTPFISHDPIVQLLTPPLSNTGMNQFDDQTFNQSSQPLQYSRRSLMEGLNNFPQSTTQSSPVHYPNQFHPRSSLPNHLMFNSSQSIVEVGHDPSTSGATSTPSYSSHSNGSNDSQSIPIRSSSFHSTDETPSNTSIFSCLKDLIHGVNSSIESDSWMEIIKPFRSVNPPPPHSLPNHSTPLANSQPAPSHILRLDNAVMANVNQYLPSSEYFNSPILE
ncbi:hypothetical protein PRIPAC_87547 [Pristionchus pacificus]|uniref:Uncharacterized protein n=1 Tax=Pristionchus pacificus TaxID=54126 RepID=A0A2A6B674_PRIPA|nr:hypothetical protein PRIPAC_87547 [Pristionchus pacificus]|eukprot:PDM61353.1 hypothetical protein PRIPAC_50795 [Pristionchus pacificus]